MNLSLAGAHAVAPGLRPVGLFLHVLVCIYMYSYVSWHVLRYVLWYVSDMYCGMYTGMYWNVLERIPEEGRAELLERLAQDHQGHPR